MGGWVLVLNSRWWVLTISTHAGSDTFLEPAVLAPVAVVLVDVAVLVEAAPVALVLPHRPLEESLAALAAHHAVVAPARPATNSHT